MCHINNSVNADMQSIYYCKFVLEKKILCFYILAPIIPSTTTTTKKVNKKTRAQNKVLICDRLQENRAQRGTLRKNCFCTYRVVGVQILSSPCFIVVA